jgi:hypothetical protein
VIVPGGRENLVAATQHELTHDLRRNVRVARLGEIAICGAANEAAFALRIEPAGCLAVRYYWSERRALPLIPISTRSALLLLLLSATTALSAAALSPAATLVASTTSVVAIIAIAVLALFTLTLTLALTLALATALVRLRIVLRLLL